MRKTIWLIGGGGGSGKTFGACQYIASTHKTQRFLVAVPTIQMVEQIAHDLRVKFGVSEVVTINSSQGINVSEEIARNLIARATARVLVITHKALENLGSKAMLEGNIQECLKEFVVFVDEVPSPILTSRVKIIAQHNHLWLKFMKASGKRYCGEGEYLMVENTDRLVSFYKDKQNADEHAKNAILAALNGYPIIKSRENAAGYVVSAYSHSPVIEIVKHCKDFYLIASNVQESPFVVVAKEWCQLDCKLAPESFQPPVDRSRHDSSRVTCHALLEKRASLSNLAKGDVYRRVCKEALAILKKDFLYASNADKKGEINCAFTAIADEVFDGCGTRTAFVSHGLNIFGGADVHGFTVEELSERGFDDIELYQRGFSKAVWLGVSRMNGEVRSHLAEISMLRGGNAELILNAIEKFASYETAYQMLLRSTLRNRSDSSPIDFVFIDVPTMKYFREVYAPDSKLGRVGIVQIESKAITTYALVQKHKMQGKTKAQVKTDTGLSRTTIHNHWN